jgi:hypothetical protein
MKTRFSSTFAVLVMEKLWALFLAYRFPWMFCFLGGGTGSRREDFVCDSGSGGDLPSTKYVNT